MTDTPLADQQARYRIEQNLDETLFVEAGAGTGKTHQLVQRIVKLISEGNVQANHIAAITFTEKAATELDDRVLEELEKQREQAESDGDSDKRQLFDDAVRQLDQAAIETLHAFAARILRMYPIAAELPPGFHIVDESEAALRFTERWRAALDELLEDESLAEPLVCALDAGVRLSDLEAVARALHNDWDRAESEDAAIKVPSEWEVGNAIESFLKDLNDIAEQRGQCSDPEDKLYIRLADIAVYAERLGEARNRLGLFAKLLLPRPNGVKVADWPRPSFAVGNAGRNANWPDGFKEQVQEEIPALEDDCDTLRDLLVQAWAAPIGNALRDFVLAYADERRRDGKLEFQDLLVRASRLLQRRPDVARDVGERFSRLLIDEFQDNDPLQTEIIGAITGGEPGRAFFVGDPKQSIYRFRRADIEQFNSVKQKNRDGLTRLSQNFRSTPGVTAFVNAVFSVMMLEDADNGQAEWDDLHAHRGPLPDVEHAVTVIGGAVEGRAPKIRRHEAGELTRLIANITAKPWQVFDKSLGKNGDTRDARFADTAVLVPTRTGLQYLLPALEEADIPYRLESRSLVYHTREIRDVLNLLRAVDDPTDQVALLAALTSPACACADDDLYRWKQARGQWDYRREPPDAIPPDDPVAESMVWLRQTAERRWEMSVSALLGHVIRERRLMELAVVERQPRERWAHYRFLQEQARAFCDRGGSTLSEFLAWADHQASYDTRVLETFVPEQDHDAVRIMTIHAAKGLEFPIVVFAGLNVNPSRQPPNLLWGENGELELRFRKDLQTPGFAALWEREKELIEQEFVRRDYVGATRARDHLIMSLYRKQSKKEKAKTDAERIGRVIAEVNPPCRILASKDIPAAQPRPPEEPSQTVDPATAADQRAEWLARREAAIASLASLPRESATGVKKRAAAQAAESSDEPPALPNDEPADDLPPWRKGRAGTAIGRATHGVLQVIDLAQPDEAEIRNAAKAQATAESLIGDAATAVERLSLRAVQSEVVREAVAADRYWRELYAAAEIDGVLLDGFIDLLYEQPNGNLVVVDYKTDALRSGESVEAAVERYRLQAAAYALILEQSLGRKVERALLLFLDPDEAREVPNLEAAIEEARAALDSPSFQT